MVKLAIPALAFNLILVSLSIAMEDGPPDAQPEFVNVIGDLTRVNDSEAHMGNISRCLFISKNFHNKTAGAKLDINRTLSDDINIWFLPALCAPAELKASLDQDCKLSQDVIQKADPYYKNVSTATVCKFLELLHKHRLIDDFMVEAARIQLEQIGIPFSDFRMTPELFAEHIAGLGEQAESFEALRDTIYTQLNQHMPDANARRHGAIWAVIEALVEGLDPSVEDIEGFGPRELIIELCELIPETDDHYIEAQHMMVDLKRSLVRDRPYASQMAYLRSILPNAAQSRDKINETVTTLFRLNRLTTQNLPDELKNIEVSEKCVMRLLMFIIKERKDAEESAKSQP